MKKLIITFAVSYFLVSSNTLANQADLNYKIEKLEAKIKNLENLVERRTSAVKISMKPGPVLESEDGNFTFIPHARLQTDFSLFQDDKADNSDGTNIRRLYVGFEGKIADDWNYWIDANFANNEAKIVDAFLSYNLTSNTTLKAGQFLEPFSLEELTNDLHTTFIERASLNSLAFGRNIGASISHYSNDWSLTAGVFGDDSGTASNNDESHSFTARTTYAPINDKGKVLHFGLAGSYREADRATNSLRYRTKAENTVTSLYAVDTNNINNVENFQHYGAEVATIWKNFSLQGEYAIANINRETDKSLQISSWYAYASWFITGESRNYLGNKGIFSRLSPKKPLTKNGGTGAFELATRISNIDLNDGVLLKGGKMTNYTLATNWYPSANIRLSANYIITHTDKKAVTANDDSRSFLLRLQFDF